LSNNAFTTLPIGRRIPQVRSGEAAADVTAIRFDRPLVEHPGWADPRIARQIAEVTRAARERGTAEGYAAGWAQGRRAATEREVAELAERAAREETARRALTARTQAMLATLATSARTLADQVVPTWDGLMDTLLDGAVAVVAAAFGREVAALDGEALEAARLALRLLPPAEALTLHVNPADLELFGEDTAEGGRGDAAEGGLADGAAERDPAFEGLRIVPDTTVPAGTATARTALQSLPVDLQAALRAAEEVLRP
jgi:flagellar assembly protein FliH